jgi:hypothetical protein
MIERNLMRTGCKKNSWSRKEGMDDTFDDKWGKMDELCAPVEKSAVESRSSYASFAPVIVACVAVACVLVLCEPPIVKARKSGLSSPYTCTVRVLLLSLSIGAIGVGLERLTDAAKF